jgi:hypothetical protein
VFEADVTLEWFARHGLRWDPSGAVNTLNAENQTAFDQGFLPRCLAVYGMPNDPLFAGVWIKNEKPLPWVWWWTDPSTYQRYFDAEVLAGTRLAYLSVAPNGWILSVFRDESIGEWHARHGMTGSDYEVEFDTRTAQGLEPLVVQAGGVGSQERYGSLFVRSEEPIVRRWTVTGHVFEGSNELDAAVREFMSAHAVRAMSVAVARNGVRSQTAVIRGPNPTILLLNRTRCSELPALRRYLRAPPLTV